MPTQPRLKFFMWLAWWDRLPHKATLASRSILPTATCDSCNYPCENTIHILRDCPSAATAWNFHTLPPNVFSLDLHDWIRTNCSSSDRSWSTLFSFTSWRLWTRRNNHVFNSTIEHINQRWSASVYHESNCWSSKQASCQTNINSDHTSPDPNVNPSTWAPPPTHWHKINVDASHCSSSLITGIGGVVRDYFGSWISGWSARCTTLRPLVGEILDIKEGLLYARNNPYHYILISDCQQAVNMIMCTKRICNTSTNLILECRELLEVLPDLEIRFENGSANAVADVIARFAVKDDSPSHGSHVWNVIPKIAIETCIADISACNTLSPNPPP